MHEIVPGLVHWSVAHPRIGQHVDSYLLAERGVVLNPMLPPDGLEPLRTGPAPPTDVVLTNRHHVRDTPAFVEAFDCVVHVPEAGLDEVRAGGLDARGYGPGDELPGAMVALRVGAISADEAALHVPWAGAVAFADGLVREDRGEGPLAFVPDALMGDEPERVKAGLVESLVRVAELEPRHLLLAHGRPVVGDGAAALREFLARHR
ncbi:MAG TPA: hypothetical protein VGV40_01405 [Solirubrobacteraceae bacterium]|nr:hypothetical protein [Solirubrobacteraceae bacterium]